MQSICRVFNCIHNSSLLHAFQFTSWNFHSNAQQIHKISQEISIIVFFRLSSGPSSANPSSTDLPLDSVNCRAVRPTAPWNWCPGGLSMALPPQKPSQLPSKPIHIRKQKKKKTGSAHKFMFHYIHMWGFMRNFSRKFIALSFGQVHRPRIDPGSKVPPVQIRSFGDIITSGRTCWAHLASTLLKARIWKTSSIKWDSDVETCEAIKDAWCTRK